MVTESNEKIAVEVRRALEQDQTGIGTIYKMDIAGNTEEEMAEAFEAKTKSFVWTYRRHISALIDGNLPTATTVARGCASAIRGFVNRHRWNLSPDVIVVLEERIEECSKRASNLVDKEIEDTNVQKKTQAVEKTGVVGIYVYTLPHYYAFPIWRSEDNILADRTLMKVGKSDSNVIKRFRQQERNTALPEDPRLLRIYTGVEGKGDVEKQFHDLLSAADHRRNKARVAGSEWFLTSLKFLDALASQMNLTTFFSIEDALDN